MPTVRATRDGYNAYMREYHLRRYYRLRQEAVDRLGGKCVKCGAVSNLQLDHIDPTTKTIEVSRFLSVSLKKFWKEVEKCQVLCSECHSIKSILEQGKKLAKGTHGTISSYRYCKCELCKNASRFHREEYAKTHKRIMVNGKRVTMPL